MRVSFGTGYSSLKELTKKLDAAQAENDKAIPKGVIEDFVVPDTDSIHFIPTTTARSGLAREMGRLENDIQDIVDKDKSDHPLFIHFEHIPSNFVHISLILNTAPVPVELKPLINVYMTNFFNTPIQLQGFLQGHEAACMAMSLSHFI